jgi:hypothetical protein
MDINEPYRIYAKMTSYVPGYCSGTPNGQKIWPHWLQDRARETRSETSTALKLRKRWAVV